ncbi:hypothetical protein BFP76_00780 [Amylibacter kogurei]|uniref:Lipoprotein n=1 Tax=Paramylibacter kogurei TaxID=1889778 RepID=A0A2G5K874_9RHOB|nr:hypothetical protein BFP76_00780 [Amylibacter kogurei]
MCGLAACAADTGVVGSGKNLYFIEKQQATGFPGLGNLKAEVFNEANSFCTKKGGQFEVSKSSETQPPYLLGNYPRVSLEFRC